jgi:hypothetical protein
MKRRVGMTIFSFLLVSFWISSCVVHEIEDYQKGLSIQTQIANDEYCISEEIPVSVTIQNESQKDFLIDSGSLPAIYRLPSNMSTWAIIITGNDGETIPAKSDLEITHARESDYVVLRAGESYTKTIFVHFHSNDVDSSYEYDFIEGKTYKVDLFYQNELKIEQEVDGDKIKSWIGTISDSDTFSIKANGCGD